MLLSLLVVVAGESAMSIQPVVSRYALPVPDTSCTLLSTCVYCHPHLLHVLILAQRLRGKVAEPTSRLNGDWSARATRAATRGLTARPLLHLAFGPFSAFESLHGLLSAVVFWLPQQFCFVVCLLLVLLVGRVHVRVSLTRQQLHKRP